MGLVIKHKRPEPTVIPLENTTFLYPIEDVS